MANRQAPILALTIAAIVLAYISNAGLSPEHLLALTLLTALCLVPVALVQLGRRDYFEPIVLSLGLQFLYFGYNSISFARHPLVADAIYLAVVGVVGTAIGYYALSILAWKTAVFPRISELGDRAITVLPPITLVAWMYLLGSALTIVAIQTGNFFGQFENRNTTLAPYLSFGTSLRFFSYILLVCHALRRNPVPLSLRWVVTISFLVEVTAALVTTSKQLIAYPILAFILSMKYVRGKVNSTVVVLSGAFLVPAFVVLYVIREDWAKNIGWSGGGLTAVVDLLSSIPRMLEQASDISKYVAISESRFSGCETLLAILDTGDRLPPGYEAYRGIGYFLQLMVPRVLSPDKVHANYQVMFAHEYFGINSDLRILMPPTFVGVLHLDYGIIGIFLGHVVYGAILATLYHWLRKEVASLRYTVIPFYVVLLINLMEIETNPFELISGIIKSFMLYVLSGKF